MSYYTYILCVIGGDRNFCNNFNTNKILCTRKLTNFLQNSIILIKYTSCVLILAASEELAGHR